MKQYAIRSLIFFLLINFLYVPFGNAQNYLNSIEQFGNKADKRLENFYEPNSHNSKIERPEQHGEQPIDVTSAIKFKVKRFIYNDNITFSDQELKKVEKDYLNRDISFEDLLDLRKKLTELYIKKGYINSGVILPNQKIRNGVVIFQVINGELSKIKTDIFQYKILFPLKRDYINNRLWLGANKPLNINTLESHFEYLTQNPLIESAQAELLPTNTIGRAVLNVKVREKNPYHFNLLINNYRSPSIGANRLECNAKTLNVFGRGETLDLKVGGTVSNHFKSGMSDLSIFYNHPLTAKDLSVTFQYYQSDARVIEDPFNLIDITSESRLFEMGVIRPFYFLHPFIKKRFLDSDKISISFQMGLKAENKQSKTLLFGKGYSFSEGSENGESKIFALNFSQSLLARSQHIVFALNSFVKLGLDAMDATINENKEIPDGQFMSYSGQVQWIQKFSTSNLNDLKYIIRSDFQYAKENLLSMEKFSLGGATTVRGYRENQLVCDKAIISSIEFRFPLPFSELNTYFSIPQLKTEIAPFFDFGWGKNNKIESTSNTIYSVGIGILCHYKYIDSKIYWGRALASLDDLKDDVSIDSHEQVHFQFNCSF